MTVVDWVLIVVWLGLTLGGFWKGAVRIIFGGGGLAAGLWLAVIAGADAQAALEGVIGIPWIAAVGGRVLLVLLCTGLALLAGWGIEHTLKALHLGWVNRLLGRVGGWQAWLVPRLYGRAEADAFPVVYRANTQRRVEQLARAAGLAPFAFYPVGDPTYLAFSEWLYRLAVLAERLTPRWMKVHLVGDLVKKELL